MTYPPERELGSSERLTPMNLDSDHCLTCGIAWRDHAIWDGRETRLWSVWHPLHVPGTPVCELRNGHLMNIKRMLDRWQSNEEWIDAIEQEIERRDRDGWNDGRWGIDA